MTNHPIRNLATLGDEGQCRRARVIAAQGLARWAQSGRPDGDDLRNVLEEISAFWLELCTSGERTSPKLLHDRTRAASACTTVSLALKEGRGFFRNTPRHRAAEGPNPLKEGSLIRGAFGYMYGSIYEFHFEYPIGGYGVRKNLISVVDADGKLTPLFDWIRDQQIIVWCSRCGLDISCEISRNCPARRIREGTFSRGPRPVS